MLRKWLFAVLVMLGLSLAECWSQTTPESQMEALSRGLVVVPGKSTGVFVSWRLLGTEDSDAVTFDVLRDGTPVATDIADATSYADTRGNASHQYQVVKKVDGVAIDTSAVSMPWSQPFMQLHLSRPAAGSDCTYSPNDCSVGDVDGDGEYEIFVKWDPSNAKDNSQNGKTGNVYLDCYRVD
jgi:rhamnogalacturonan endolyase